MRKLAVKTGEKISAEAEATLQSTHQFKNELSERTQRAAELSTDYNRLCNELTALQSENMRLVKEVLPSDAVLYKELQSVQEDFEKLHRTLDSQIEEKTAAQHTRGDLELKLVELNNNAVKLTQRLESESELYRRVLKIEMIAIDSNIEPEELELNKMNDTLPDKFRVNFLDLNQSAILAKKSLTSWQIDTSGHSVEGNPNNWADLTRMLYKTRKHLRSCSLNSNSSGF